jgi:hypothetical protein
MKMFVLDNFLDQHSLYADPDPSFQMTLFTQIGTVNGSGYRLKAGRRANNLFLNNSKELFIKSHFNQVFQLG